MQNQSEITPDLAPVLPGFSEPRFGKLEVLARNEQEFNDVAGTEEGLRKWYVGYYGTQPIWHSLRLGSAIARANGIGGEDELKQRLDSLSDDAKDWLDQTCHRFADSQGYEKRPKLIEECLQVGLIEKHRGRIEVSGEVMNLVYSESYFRAKPTPPKPEDQACDLPPAGWYCTRESGHEGPCAAVELSSKTPRTDAALIPVHGVATDYVDADFSRQLESDLAASRASLGNMEAKANRNRKIRDSLVKLFKDDGWQDDCTLINQLTNMNFD